MPLGARLARALAAVVVLVPAACSSGGDDAAVVDGGSSATDPSAPGLSAPEDDAEDRPTTVSRPGGTAPGGSSTTVSGTGGGDGGGGATTTTAPTVPRLGGVGDFAPFYLRPAASAAIALEVFAAGDARPAAATVDHVRSVLAEVSGKPVSVRQGDVDGATRSWTSAMIQDLSSSIGGPGSSSEAVLRLLYLHGDYQGDDSVLGVAVRSEVAAIFVDQVEAASGLVGDPDVVEDAVTVHEVGHLLGLVDLYLSTGRADPDHPGHSSNPDSVMYWAVESSLIGQLLGSGPPNEFDDADRADLAVIRGG